LERIPGPYVGDPWDRQPQESDTQYARFNFYLDQEPGRRTYTAVAEEFEVDPATIRAAADRYRWRDRAALYDQHRVKQRRDRIAAQESALAEQQMNLARAATQVLSRSVAAVMQSGAVLDPKDMPSWARMIEIMRKMALDRPDQIVEVTANGFERISEFEGLSPEQMQERAAEMASSVLRVINGGKAS
jgi:hypothetical protein